MKFIKRNDNCQKQGELRPRRTRLASPKPRMIDSQSPNPKELFEKPVTISTISNPFTTKRLVKSVDISERSDIPSNSIIHTILDFDSFIKIELFLLLSLGITVLWMVMIWLSYLLLPSSKSIASLDHYKIVVIAAHLIHIIGAIWSEEEGSLIGTFSVLKIGGLILLLCSNYGVLIYRGVLLHEMISVGLGIVIVATIKLWKVLSFEYCNYLQLLMHKSPQDISGLFYHMLWCLLIDIAIYISGMILSVYLYYNSIDPLLKFDVDLLVLGLILISSLSMSISLTESSFQTMLLRLLPINLLKYFRRFDAREFLLIDNILDQHQQLSKRLLFQRALTLLRPESQRSLPIKILQHNCSDVVNAGDYPLLRIFEDVLGHAELWIEANLKAYRKVLENDELPFFFGNERVQQKLIFAIEGELLEIEFVCKHLIQHVRLCKLTKRTGYKTHIEVITRLIEKKRIPFLLEEVWFELMRYDSFFQVFFGLNQKKHYLRILKKLMLSCTKA